MYIEKLTQEEKILNVLNKGLMITQIDLENYYSTSNGKCVNNGVADALLMGIANLPARIFGLRKKGYDIVSEDVKTKNSHYVRYKLNKKEENND